MITDMHKSSALELAHQNYRKHSTQEARSFLSITDLSADETKLIVHRGLEMKRKSKDFSGLLQGKMLALLFQKTSTRTRSSFGRAALELGAVATYIDWRTSNFVLADLRDETKVLSRFYDMIVARVVEHEMLTVMAEYSEVPVINGMCDRMHPCQALADFLTMAEYFGPDLTGLRIAYVGDGNNVCRSLVHGAINLNAQIVLCSPKAYALDEKTITAGQSLVSCVDNPMEAVRNADVIYTDTWVSIGSEAETNERLVAFAPYQVNQELVAAAPRHALIMHPLPAHPGQEITTDVLRSPRSVVFDQAENRTHASKALLQWLAV